MLSLLLILLGSPQQSPDDEVKAYRQERETSLRAEEGWLSLAGLFFLKPGANTFGSAPTNDIRFPEQAPARAGVFVLSGDVVVLEPDKDAKIEVGGAPLTSQREMKPDTSEAHDVATMGRFTFRVIKRGDRYAIRLWDRESPARTSFKGRVWYPVNPAYRVVARFVPSDPPKKIAITDILGQVSEMDSPGYVTFTLGGRELRLEPVLEDPGELFFMFRDETSAKTTYGSGRFLYSSLPKDGTVVLDFNKAVSPPCSFTKFATCPLPPKQNRLPIAIEAGEKALGHH
jgi:uncharacterized protein (DUF1684 family)